MDKNILFTIKPSSGAPASDFPTEILRWIKRNTTPQFKLRLMYVNKYFLHKYFPFKKVKYILNCDTDNKWKWKCSFNEQCEHCNDLENVPNNLWLTESFYLSAQSHLPVFLKIVGCDIEYLHLQNVVISYNDFVFLTKSGKVESLHFNPETFVMNDERVVSLDIILQHIPHAYQFDLCNNYAVTITPDIAQKFADSNLEIIGLDELTEDFDYPAFLDFMKQRKPLVNLTFTFSNSVSTEYAKSIQIYVDDLIKAGLSRYLVTPRFYFPTQTDECEDAIEGLMWEYIQKYS